MQRIIERSAGVSLSSVLPDSQLFGGDGEPRFTSCCSDSRRCRPGDLFVALTGGTHDGHDYIREAVANGAAGVIAERPLLAGVPVYVVPDSREALGHVCQNLAGNPTQSLGAIGVTGTNGKTATSMLIASVLKAAGRFVGSTTGVGFNDGFECNTERRTTPAQPEMAEWLSRMVANGCDNAVVELSSRALAERRCAGMQLQAAVLTNVRRDHLDRHGSLLNYRRAKMRIFEHLAPNGFAVLSNDDPVTKMLINKISHPVITVGLHTPAELTATVVERHMSEQTFLLQAGSDSVPVRTRTIGNQHVYNCLSAAALGLVMGIDLMTVARGLESLEYTPGQLQRLECGQPFGVFIDAAANADALAMSLKALRRVTTGRVICVFGVDSQRDPGNRPMIGRVLEKAADVPVISSNNPRHEKPLEIVHDILDGFEKPGKPHLIPDRQKAIVWALEQAEAGDSVLIAGKGNDDAQEIAGRSYCFSDRDVARDWLYQVGAKIDYDTPRHIIPFADHVN